ncbi:MAG: Bro-N domain-containing protein, partial [Prevotella sp.]|nr:Bro-N domain-containing protein [Prevotella sp.]
MSNKQEAKVFTFNENNKPIRVEVVDGEPWFVAKDVCDALGIENNRNATARLEDDEKGTSIVRTPSGEQTMTTVNESGLYNLIFQSRKPEAKNFRKWVTSEVLPSIRKTGRYEVGQSASGGSAVARHPRRSRNEKVNAELMNLLWLIGESLL